MIPATVDIDSIVSDLSTSDVYVEEGVNPDDIDLDIELQPTQATGPTKVLYFHAYYRPADLRDIAQAVLNRTDSEMVVARVWQHGAAVSHNLSRYNLESNDAVMEENLAQASVNSYLSSISKYDNNTALVNGSALTSILLVVAATVAALKSWGKHRSQ